MKPKKPSLIFNHHNEEQFARIDAFIGFLNIKSGELQRKSDLIVILHQAQQIFGYLPSEVQEYIAEKLNITTSEISRIINFYDYFTTEPQLQCSEIA